MTSPRENNVQILNYVPDITIKTEMVTIEIEDEDYNIPCRFCNKVFANEVAIKNHVRIHHFREDVDTNVWVNEAIATQHENEDNTDQKTTEQQQNTTQGMHLMNVMHLASKDVNFIVVRRDETPIENKRKKSQEQMLTQTNMRHVLTTVSGPFECQEPCHQIFFSCCDYSIHYRDEHTKRRKGVKCQVCEKLLPPTLGEETESPYQCQAEHTPEHAKLKPYACTVCHKRFTQQGGVVQHMRMHTGDRPYTCTYCPKAFTQKSGLDQHLRIHTKEKPYRCIICQKSFCQSVHLKQHMRTHTNVTPFQCMICYKKFKQSSHLNYHLKNHDTINLTDDQKAKYNEMLGMIQTTDISEQKKQNEQNCEQIVLGC